VAASVSSSSVWQKVQRGLGVAVLVGLAGGLDAWPAWWLAAAWVPWRSGLGTARQKGQDALLVLAAVALGAFWGWLLPARRAPVGPGLVLAAALLALWAGARWQRQDDALARAGLSAAGWTPWLWVGWSLGQGDMVPALSAAMAALLAWLWAQAGAALRAPQASARAWGWRVAGWFFVGTLALGAGTGWVWQQGPATRGAETTAANDAAPTPHPELAATLTAVAQGAAQPAPSPTPQPTATATASPSPTATLSPTPSLTPTVTPTPTLTPFPTFPPPPVYTGYGVVQVPPSWGQGAYVRAEPNENAKLVAVVENGTLLKVLGYRAKGVQIWLKVRSLTAGWEGWIISTALQVATPPAP